MISSVLLRVAPESADIYLYLGFLNLTSANLPVIDSELSPSVSNISISAAAFKSIMPEVTAETYAPTFSPTVISGTIPKLSKSLIKEYSTENNKMSVCFSSVFAFSKFLKSLSMFL